MKKIKEMDVIIPCHWVDWAYFTSNVKSWFDELPIRKLYFGCNNKDDEFFTDIKEYLSSYEKIEFIDQRDINTLGMQIANLMKQVKTDWFVYCHSDAYICRHSFLMMEADMSEDVGLIESEHINFNGNDWIYPKYYYVPRSFSGFQLFRLDAVKEIIGRIEDDYIYRNEDIIFQNACTEAGFKFVKSWAPHIHYATINGKWTPKGEYSDDSKAITYDMQAKGIVKYCAPTRITKKAWRAGFGGCIRHCNADLFGFLEDFIKDDYPEWKKAIRDIISELLRGIYC